MRAGETVSRWLSRWLKLIAGTLAAGVVTGILVGVIMSAQADAKLKNLDGCTTITEANQGACEELVEGE